MTEISYLKIWNVHVLLYVLYLIFFKLNLTQGFFYTFYPFYKYIHYTLVNKMILSISLNTILSLPYFVRNFNLHFKLLETCRESFYMTHKKRQAPLMSRKGWWNWECKKITSFDQIWIIVRMINYREQILFKFN